MHGLGEQDRDAFLARPSVHVFVHRRADADLHRAARIDQLLLDRVIKRRAVAKALAETIRPRVDMRVEMDERQGPGARGEGAEQCQRYRVIAAERYEMAERLCLGFD